MNISTFWSYLSNLTNFNLVPLNEMIILTLLDPYCIFTLFLHYAYLTILQYTAI